MTKIPTPKDLQNYVSDRETFLKETVVPALRKFLIENASQLVAGERVFYRVPFSYVRDVSKWRQYKSDVIALLSEAGYKVTDTTPCESPPWGATQFYIQVKSEVRSAKWPGTIYQEQLNNLSSILEPLQSRFGHTWEED